MEPPNKWNYQTNGTTLKTANLFYYKSFLKKTEKNRFHQFLKLWIGAGILPLRLTNSSQPKRLTGMMGA